MRGLRSLLLLVIIAIPLGWYVYRDMQRPAGDDLPKKDKVFTVESDKIEEISVKSESGERTQLKRTGGEWKIVAPAAGQPDATEIAGLASNLSSAEVQQVVDENPPDLKEYGLATPRIEVGFTSGGQQHTLLIGQKTPPGTDLYAKRGEDKKVFLIPAHLESTFNRSTFDLRDKSVMKIDRDKLDAVEFTAGDKTGRFVRPGGGEWQIAAPVQARADFSAIEGLVSRLAGLQMKSIVDTPEADGKKYGLDKPAATVRFGSGSSQASLALGGPAAEGTIYARDLSRPAIFTVESSVLDELKKDPAEFRQKDLFDARAFNATRVEIARAGQTHSFEKTKAKNKQGQDEEKWRQLTPQARELDQASFDTLLNALTGLRATGFVDAAAAKALTAPELSATIKFDEGKKEDRVTLAKAGTDGFAARAGEPGAAKVEASAVDAVVKALQELK